MSNNNYQYLVCRNSKSDNYSLWEFDPENPRLVSMVKTSTSATPQPVNSLRQQ
jgi:6-phosphogluconolactonase (cycloisomerase 2 family)